MQIIQTSLLIFFVSSSSSCLFANEDKKPKEPIEVFAYKINKTEMYDAMVYGGFIESAESYVVNNELEGRLSQLNVTLGQFVKVATPLYIVRPASSGYKFKEHQSLSPRQGTVTEIYHREGDHLAKNSTILRIENTQKLMTTIYVTHDDLAYFKAETKISLTLDSSSSTKKPQFSAWD